MEKYDLFKTRIKDVVSKFKILDKNKTIRVIRHLDSDGISAGSILIKALKREGMRYSLSIVPQLKDSIFEELKREDYETYVFTDLGSGQIETIAKCLAKKQVFVLDHHTIDKDLENFDGIYHVNPHLFDITNDREISGSGVVFLFVKELNGENEDLADLAIIGAIGDVQEKDGFKKLNDEILNIAIEKGIIEKTRSLRFFGAETKPLHKLLCYSTDPFIPGISGNESNTLEFLRSLNINPKVGDKWRKLCNLTKKEMEDLTSAIIIKRSNEKDPNDILGNIYKITSQEEGIPTRDAREFSTLLNACGRLDKASLGIGTCLGDENSKSLAINALSSYKKEIMNSLKWFENNKDSKDIIQKKGFMIINAKDNVLGTIIGTLASIIAHSNDIPLNTFILSLARVSEDMTKVSLRISGRENKNIDLKQVIEEIVDISGGQSGGHTFAAGAIISTSIEEKFISASLDILSKKALEEAIVIDSN